VGSDFGSAPRVALVDQAAARRYWPGRNPIGSRIAFTQDDPQPWLEVVGIVGSIRSYAFDEEMRPRIYLPATTDPVHDRDLLIRSTGVDRAGLIASVRAAVARLDNDLPVAMFALDALLSEELQGVYVIASLLTAAAIVTLLLAATGIYGVASYSVSRRVREIGIRMALGAQGQAVVRMVLGRESMPVVVGTLIGVAAAVPLVVATASALTGVNVWDAGNYAGVVATLIATALLAAYIPARRATRVDPLIALRAE
jgi:putative ABC transport system permease protein